MQESKRNCELRCNELFLPLPKLPTSAQLYTDPSDWPPDEWHTKLGCWECGFVSVYAVDDVDWRSVRHEGSGQYCADVVCVRVEFLCGQKDCKSPVKFHVAISDRRQTTYDELREKISKDFFMEAAIKDTTSCLARVNAVS